ncbi:CBY1-interacting BAR domain-containing protein 1-A isoform X2 [Bombus affinis]|uniref:CBY1-interacting BAR domain-containing protein 1-A isoform X2 n=1 Tax=Bombus terrestris TaxID=30195 RepID=A0A9B2JKG6_BOMTE|nr:CBY1-interacting BAR domain-containing protein 1-A isoform X2 [Bombus terrestris]XP_043580114.1 protein FAM92A-A isoform X2 [Bombus pyrosoma]XP_050583940.1 CBY1-interacting BAR domain-containing protein 1-A isoform X2 [Bombus affinis]
MLRSRSQSSIWEQEAKFVQDRISNVEKHFAELCTTFAAYTRKAARLRDKGDEIAKIIETYAQSETINQSLSNGLANFSATLSVIGDYRDAKVQRFDAKIISPLSQYATICKHARDDVKNTFTTRDKELTRKRHLDRLRERNPRNRQMISQAESELMKASVEVSRVVKGLEEQIDAFEKRKLHDLKTVLLDFIIIELSFHAKTLELLTKGYQDIAEIDEVKDLEEFREVMHIPDSIARLPTVGRTSFRQSYSLTNLASRFMSSPANSQKLANHAIESTSIDSAKSSLKTNSSESVQIEEFRDSSEETESESTKEKPIELQANSGYKDSTRLIVKTIPPIPIYQKFLTMPMMIKHG